MSHHHCFSNTLYVYFFFNRLYVLFSFFCLLDLSKETEHLFRMIRFLMIINCVWITDVCCHILVPSNSYTVIKASFFKQLWKWAGSFPCLLPTYMKAFWDLIKLHWPPCLFCILFSIIITFRVVTGNYVQIHRTFSKEGQCDFNLNNFVMFCRCLNSV